MFKSTNLNTQIQTIENNCVKVSHIPKIHQVCRHLDTILQQTSSRTGPVRKRTVLSEPRHPPRPDDDDTIGFIQLEDVTKLPTLMYLFQDYKFHGKYLKAELCHFNFNYMEEYVPILHKCIECADYGHMLRVRERDLKARAIQDETNRIHQANIYRRKGILSQQKVEVEKVAVSDGVSFKATKSVGVQVRPEVAIEVITAELGKTKLVRKDSLKSPSIEVLAEEFVSVDYDFYN